ncbi:MAG TPA: FixH family protein [Thermoanaerobaculia bacterium]|nr:FixH family protein [Thermoanaerobaculia bacterium]
MSRPEARLFVLWLAVCLAGAGCQPPSKDNPDIALEWSIQPDPPFVGPAKASLTLTDAKAGRPVEGAEVRLEGNMAHAGMKPVFSTAREVAPGRYEAPLDFTMGGDWFILIDATLRDGRTLQKQVDLRGVRSR